MLVSGDPDKACGTHYVTQHFLERAYGGEAGCAQAQSAKSAASSVRVDDVELHVITDINPPSRKAFAEAVPDGGLYDGEKLTISLVKEDGDWKIDSLKSNAPVGP